MKSLLIISLLLSTQAFAELPVNYQKLSSVEKRSLLWQEIESSEYSDEDLPEFTQLVFLKNAGKALIPSFLRKAFTTQSDEMPFEEILFTGISYRRPKIIHSFGSSALVKYTPTENHKFTGVFAKETLGLARVSNAAPLRFTPGIAVKFFVNGAPSVNIHAIHSLTLDQKDCHPFEPEFSNIIPPATGFLKAAAVVFEKVAKERGGRSNHLTVDHLAQVNTDNPIAPYKIVLKPSQKAKSLDFNCDGPDYRKVMEELNSGDLLYEVFANAHENGNFEKVGELTLESSFVASKYGDKVLFFQHDIQK